MVDISKKLKLVGEFIKKKRESLGISQRALGQHFNPPVTTQFISNVERGVTPLPPAHIPVLAKALQLKESELTVLLEKEYALKLNGRLGIATTPGASEPTESSTLSVAPGDYQLMRSLYEAYRSADSKTQEAFVAACQQVLNLSK